ncbi:ABC-F family ATP-binding cassette domain-containing protein [Celerinatantimonas yamalensis]|uniref:ABC-F family ATP-binding cassette domain-containing protein n=1 Tax=Celerinatantimonas yamalensis TaxID=559956 RepID=A0ABW9G850_9GAMM
MSTYLSAQSLSTAFSSEPLFESVSFTIHRGDKIGLIGHNGCGKSTLLKILSGQPIGYSGQIALSKQCLLAYVEQSLPTSLLSVSLLQALAEQVSVDALWKVERLLSELGFSPNQWQQPVQELSGGQQMRLLLARAVINQPDLLLLDEPSNHLDLPALLWLESYLRSWQGSFVLVSHDDTLLDKVTHCTWIMRDKTLHHFNLSCSAARQALIERDETDRLRHQSEQKEIDRLAHSAKRLATWGKVYDNEDLARKAKTMQARKERLEAQQTQLSDGAPWTLRLQGDTLPANRLLAIEQFFVKPASDSSALFSVDSKQVKSGDRIAIIGRNGTGKSTFLNCLYALYQQQEEASVQFHPSCQLGYYDQSLHQLHDDDSLIDALQPFAPIGDELRKRALISAGFEFQRHQQKIASLSGGERSRLLFVGLTLARYHLVLLDEPTNHLDLEGKEELISTLQDYQGAVLLVSHDRRLIEQSCNRFWLIDEGQLSEYLDIEAIYRRLSDDSNELASDSDAQSAAASATGTPAHHCDEEVLLQQLIELEACLDADCRRKAKHQKPALQAKWRQAIIQLKTRLELF